MRLHEKNRLCYLLTLTVGLFPFDRQEKLANLSSRAIQSEFETRNEAHNEARHKVDPTGNSASASKSYWVGAGFLFQSLRLR
jgi:hypothetical protein